MGFRRPAPELTKDTLSETSKALVFTWRLRVYIRGEVEDTKDTNWTAKVKTAMGWLTMSPSEEQDMVFGCTDIQAAVLTLLVDLVPWLAMIPARSQSDKESRYDSKASGI